MVRCLFADGSNSVYHLLFGILASRVFVILPIFILYQFSEHIYLRMSGRPDNNMLVDLAEFFIGYICSAMLALKY
jgi:hypothetical protein